VKASPNSFSWFAGGALRLSESSAFPRATTEAQSSFWHRKFWALRHRRSPLRSKLRADSQLKSIQSVVGASRRLKSQHHDGAPRRSAAPGSQRVVSPQAARSSGSKRCGFKLPISRHGLLFVAVSSRRSAGVGAVGGLPPAAPNPSIEGTSNGGPRLLAFAGAVPPLLAPHLKR